MPLNPLPPRACRSNPTKYAFSDNESDEEGYSPFSSPDVATESPLPRSASPSSPSSPSPLPSPCKSHSRKRSPSHIRRPRNAFIIFRSEFCFKQKATEQNIETDHRQISRIAAYIWRDLSEDEKAEYKRRAEEEKAAHKVAYPNYRYAPVGRPRTVVRQKSKRNNSEEIYRCRAAAEQYLSGLQGKSPENLNPTVPPDEKSAVIPDPGTSSSQRGSRRHLSTKRRKEQLSVSLPKEEKNHAGTTVEVSNKDYLISDRPPSPLAVNHHSSLKSDPTQPQETIAPKPVDFMGDMVCKSELMSPFLPSSTHQDSTMPSSIDHSSDDFSNLTLGQLFNAADDPSNSELSHFMDASSFNGCGEEEDFYNTYPDSETCFSTPSETFFSGSSSRGTTFFEARLEDEKIVDSLFEDNSIIAYNNSIEFEEYLDL